MKKSEQSYLWEHFFNSALQGIMANPERWKDIAQKYEKGELSYDDASIKNCQKAANIADHALHEYRIRYDKKYKKIWEQNLKKLDKKKKKEARNTKPNEVTQQPTNNV